MNENYFTDIDTEEKAYYLGLLYADGCVNKKGNSISIHLQKRDGYILNNLQQAINPNESLKLRVEKNPNSQNQLEFRVSNIQLKSDLIKWGCLPCKSTFNKDNIKLPQLNYNLTWSFIRGFFDGDGSIYQPNLKKNSRTIEFYSTSESFIKGLQSFIGFGSIKIREEDIKLNIYILRFCSQSDLLKLRTFFYEINDNYICLERKKDKFYGLAVPIKRPFICPNCSSKDCNKNGKRRGKQRLKCNNCGNNFTYEL